jgi:parallel beta-helix repeat protein
MKPTRGAESDGDYPRLVLSMRAKVSVVGLCFVLVMSLLVYSNVPYAVQALRGLAQGEVLGEPQEQVEEEPPREQGNNSQPQEQATLTENERQPPGLEEPPDSPGFHSVPIITIESDGSIDQPWAPIQRDGEVFTFTDNILYASIHVFMDSIVLDGAGHAIQGSERTDLGVLIGEGNVTLKNTKIHGFEVGIRVNGDNALITGNTVSDSDHGLQIYSSSSVSVIGNRVSENEIGIDDSESNSTIVGNLISDNEIGVVVSESDSVITDNMVSNNRMGISVENQREGPAIHHNDFVNNTEHARDEEFLGIRHARYWDNGYPSGGNYWDNYGGWDVDGDGIGETPYIIDEYDEFTEEGKRFSRMYLDEEGKLIHERILVTPDQDRYPLMKPWTGIPEPALLSILGLILLSAMLRRHA